MADTTPVDAPQSLRDWFAGQALAALLSTHLAQSKSGTNFIASPLRAAQLDQLAKQSYDAADAMLRVRSP